MFYSLNVRTGAIVTGVVALASVPLFVFSETNTTTSNVTPVAVPHTTATGSNANNVEARLRARVAELEAQVAQLRAELAVWKARAENIAGNNAQGMRPASVPQMLQEKRLERLLAVGMSGEDVRMLQEVLAKDPGVYPEGLITGYFGPRTEVAIKRFKEKHGITEEDGRVFGPRVLAFLNQWLRGEGVKNVPSPGTMMRGPSMGADKRVEELLQAIRAGKRGEELKQYMPKKADVDDKKDENATDE